VVVDDLDLPGVRITPGEAGTPPVVDADAVLPGAVLLELLQADSRWNPQVLEALGVAG